MRPITKTLSVAFALLFSATTFAQAGKVLLERSVTIPRDATFGNETLSRGSYRIALTEVDGDMWFVVKKGGEEVARDVAIVLPNDEIPTQGLKAEVLKGEEYYRVRVRQGDKVYLMYFLLKGGKA